MKILTFAGSLRKDSYNKKICQAAVQFVRGRNLAEIEYVDLQPLQIPIYDGDLETASGLPEGVKKLCALIQQADALIICSPENNGSIAAALKMRWTGSRGRNRFRSPTSTSFFAAVHQGP